MRKRRKRSNPLFPGTLSCIRLTSFWGLDLLQLHRAEKALPYLRNATALQPGSGEAATALARDYEQMHDPAKAAYWFDRPQTEPQNIDAWYGMGIAYLELEKSVTEKLAAQDSKSPFRQLLLADSAADEGRSDQAIRIYKEAAGLPFFRTLSSFAAGLCQFTASRPCRGSARVHRRTGSRSRVPFRPTRQRATCLREWRCFRSFADDWTHCSHRSRLFSRAHTRSLVGLGSGKD